MLVRVEEYICFLRFIFIREKEGNISNFQSLSKVLLEMFSSILTEAIVVIAA